MTADTTKNHSQFDLFTMRVFSGQAQPISLSLEKGISQSCISVDDCSALIQIDYAHRPVFIIHGANCITITNDRKDVRNATVNLEPDTDILRKFVKYGSAMETNVPYRGVECIAPGKQINISDDRILVETYQSKPPGDPITERDHVEEALVNSIRTRISGKKFAFALSGGVDSTLLATLAKKHNLCEVTAYTGKTAFGSDLKYSRIAAKNLGVNLVEVEIPVTTTQLDLHRSLTEAASGPITIQGNSVGFATICLAAQKDGFDGIVDGTGAEHIFGGNQAVHGLHWAAEQLRLGHHERVDEFVSINLQNSLINRRTVSDMKALAKVPLSFRDFMFDDLTSGRVRKYENHQNAIASMIGFDVITPFIDHDVGRYLLNDSHEYFQSGWNKSVLREIMAKYLPSEVAYRVNNEPLRWPTANLISVLGTEMEKVLSESGILELLPSKQKLAIKLHTEKFEGVFRPLLKISRRNFSQAYAAGVFLQTSRGRD